MSVAPSMEGREWAGRLHGDDKEDDDDDCNGHSSLQASFQLGAESSTERLHELQFSLAHSEKADREEIAEEIEAFQQRHIEEYGCEIEDKLANAEYPDREDELEKAVFDDFVVICGSPEKDAVDSTNRAEAVLSSVMPIERVASKDVVFETRVKKAKVLNGYVMGDVLGEGSYAKVKEAIEQKSLCRRAIKIMKRKKLRKIPHGESNVDKEIRLLAKLNHENVMRQIEVFYNEEKGKIYIVLEYCCAVLKDMLEASPLKKFPVWQAHFYFNQLLMGLEYLHSCRVIHKDIKPGNLLLNTAGTLKIADFGVAEMLDLFAPDDTCKTSQGTPAFQPPEIASGVSSFSGFKMDVWSSGVTLYNLVTGTYPFEGSTIFKLYENIVKAEFEIPNDIHDDLQSLIRAMLQKDPSERFSVRDARHHDWSRKRHPCLSPGVTVETRDDDPALSTTVIPYLCDLHFGSQIFEDDMDEDNEEGGELIVASGRFTEHDLHVQQEQMRAQEGSKCVPLENTSEGDSMSGCLKLKSVCTLL